MSVGTNIKEIRESKNISVDKIIKKLRFLKKYYLRLEKGIEKPNDKTVRKIAKALNVSYNYIINYNKDKSDIYKKELDSKNLKYESLSKNLENKEDIKVGETTFVPIKKPTLREIIYQRSKLLNDKDRIKFEKNINLVGFKDILPNTVSNSISGDFNALTQSDQKTTSPRLLNWVEPYNYKGFDKTLFYTEINTGLKKGDKVFILNGFYDSNKLIKNKKYGKNSDGYDVLFVDNCKIVLDIDYTGDLPYKSENIYYLINLYTIRSEEDFKHVNKQITTYNGEFDFKFNKNNDSIVYCEDFYSGLNDVWGQSGPINGPGFFIKNGTQSWTNVTNDFISGSYSLIVSDQFSEYEVKSMNGNINYLGNEFKEGEIYKYNTELGWEINTEYNESIITKSNFRGGKFKGIFNSGVFGRKDKKITWNGEHSKWNQGTLFNSIWLSGIMDSIYTLPTSYVSEFENGKPYQKTSGVRNNGWGYNYIIDSEITSGNINGIIENADLGEEKDYSIVENHILGTQSEYSFKIKNAILKKCRLKSGYALDCDLVNSLSYNTLFENIKSLNSTFKNSIIKNSKYLTKDSLRIIGYNELSLNLNSEVEGPTHKVYKFHISKQSYDSLRFNDSFYIKNLKINDNSKIPLNFFNKKFKFSNWSEYIDYFDGDDFDKKEFKISAFLSTPKENEFLYNTYFSPMFGTNFGNYYTKIIGNIQDEFYSVDIFVPIEPYQNTQYFPGISGFESEFPSSEISNYGLNLNNDTSIATPFSPNLTNKIRNAVDISEAFIINSDFESGIIETSDWISGDNINYNSNIKSSNGIYDISINYPNLIIKVKKIDNTIKKGDIVFLDNITHLSDDGTETILSDSYKVDNIIGNLNSYILSEIGNNILPNVIGGTFSTPDANNRYNYVFKSKILSSKIKSGIFRRSYINKSLIENDDYDVGDLNFNNMPSIKTLVISDSIFKDNENILSKAIYLYTSFVNDNDIFRNGIVFKSIWNNMTFLDGLFKESTWLDGKFENGIFYNNRSFNFNPTTIYPNFNDNSVKSYYKLGSVPNDRYSWQNGEFNGGEFYKSDWEDGVFNDGEFYYSNFYKGVINGGFLGKKSIKLENTKIFNAEINYSTVLNAELNSKNPNLNGVDSANINWYDGLFLDGLFSSDHAQQTNNSSIWYNGDFNGGDFKSMAIWKNGRFNGGKFKSIYGWTMSNSPIKENYTWQDGEFNGGEFGNENVLGNSTWYTGEFNGGKFTGRVWNDGVFSFGEFKGSGLTASGLTSSNNVNDSDVSYFVDSFEEEYFGLWRNGIVTDEKDKFIEDKNFFTDIKRFNYKEPIKNVLLENVLWLNGIFSHNSGKVYNSVWLNGRFEKGKFEKSSFNPYVKRNGDLVPSFELSDNCYWKNGNLIDSDFFISKWEYGKFNKGNSYGMIWKDGICEYMDGFNIFWENGVWKNGNWQGSNFDYYGIIEDDFTFQILNRGKYWREEELGQTSSSIDCHIWNIFDDGSLNVEDLGTYTASHIVEVDVGNNRNKLLRCFDQNDSFYLSTSSTYNGVPINASTYPDGTRVISNDISYIVSGQVSDISNLSEVNGVVTDFTGCNNLQSLLEEVAISSIIFTTQPLDIVALSNACEWISNNDLSISTNNTTLYKKNLSPNNSLIGDRLYYDLGGNNPYTSASSKVLIFTDDVSGYTNQEIIKVDSGGYITDILSCSQNNFVSINNEVWELGPESFQAIGNSFLNIIWFEITESKALSFSPIVQDRFYAFVGTLSQFNNQFTGNIIDLNSSALIKRNTKSGLEQYFDLVSSSIVPPTINGNDYFVIRT